MMKLNVFFIPMFLILQSCIQDFTSKKYGFVSTIQEWEIELVFKDDNTFILKDRFGCNQLLQKGKWKILDKDDERLVLLLEDKEIKIENSEDRFKRKIVTYKSDVDGRTYSNRQESQFPLITKDTVVISKSSLLLNNKTFVETTENLQMKRVLQIEVEFINKYGEKDYIESFGEGKSKELARKNLIKCGVQ